MNYISNLKSLIKSYSIRAGWDIILRKSNPANNSLFQLKKCIDLVLPELILDIGANEGQFIKNIRDIGIDKKILAVEPINKAYLKLCKLRKNKTSLLTCVNAAIGEKNGMTNINISSNSVSSSLLEMKELHKKAEKLSQTIDNEEVRMITIDSLLEDYDQTSKNIFLKLDTQGYEWQVLDGAKKSIKRIKGIMCELTLTPLYEGQYLWKDVISRLEEEGFILWALQKGFTNPNDGRTLQLDGIFIREENILN